MTATEPTILSAILAWLSSSIPHVLAALAFIIGGIWLSRVCERMVHRLMDSRLGVEPTLRGVLGSGVRYLVLGVCLLAAIGQLGFQTSSLLAVLATAGLAVGLALQATLSNVAAGIIIPLAASLQGRGSNRGRCHLGQGLRSWPLRNRDPFGGRRLSVRAELRALEQTPEQLFATTKKARRSPRQAFGL